MSDPLETIRAAVDERRRADEAITAGIRAARQSGLTLQAIATAAGVTRQRVWQVVNAPDAREAAMRARLADIELERVARLLDEAAKPPPGAYGARGCQGAVPRSRVKSTGGRAAERQVT